jgi:hypothetical protein
MQEANSQLSRLNLLELDVEIAKCHAASETSESLPSIHPT